MKIAEQIKHTTAQMTVVGLLLVFLTLMVYSSLSDTITDTATNISDNLTAKGYDEEGLLARMIPMFVIVCILASIAMYSGPQT